MISTGKCSKLLIFKKNLTDLKNFENYLKQRSLQG